MTAEELNKFKSDLFYAENLEIEVFPLDANTLRDHLVTALKAIIKLHERIEILEKKR